MSPPPTHIPNLPQDFDIEIEVTRSGGTTPEVQNLVKSVVRSAVYSKRASDRHMGMQRMPSDLEGSKHDDSTLVINEELEEDHLIV